MAVSYSEAQSEGSSYDFDMQLIGNFLSFASRGDRVGLNQMLRDGISPNVQDYDKRTALHLAASEGHAPIIELLILYKANVNPVDRWHHTPLTDARHYRHRDICRILEVNGGVDFVKDQTMTGNDSNPNEVNIDISELILQHSSMIDQGKYGESEKVKWRGTWVVKTVITRPVQHPDNKVILSAKDNTLLRELRHPNILQFLGSIIHGEEMILITEYLPNGSLDDIMNKKTRLDLQTALRYALDIARGMNYLHEHKPFPIVHNHLNPRNLLQDEGEHLKVGEYWIQMLCEQIHPKQDIVPKKDKSGCRSSSPSIDTRRDIRSFGIILYQMLEGRHEVPCSDFDCYNQMPINFQPKFLHSKCPIRIQELIVKCMSRRSPSFSAVIQTLEEVSETASVPGRAPCPVC